MHTLIGLERPESRKSSVVTCFDPGVMRLYKLDLPCDDTLLQIPFLLDLLADQFNRLDERLDNTLICQPIADNSQVLLVFGFARREIRHPTVIY